MKTPCNFGQTVFLVPTEGCYQKTLEAVMLIDTPSQYRVRVKTESYVRKFRKSNMLHVSPSDRKFPNYKLEIPTNPMPILDQYDRPNAAPPEPIGYERDDHDPHDDRHPDEDDNDHDSADDNTYPIGL